MANYHSSKMKGNWNLILGHGVLAIQKKFCNQGKCVVREKNVSVWSFSVSTDRPKTNLRYLWVIWLTFSNSTKPPWAVHCSHHLFFCGYRLVHEDMPQYEGTMATCALEEEWLCTVCQRRLSSLDSLLLFDTGWCVGNLEAVFWKMARLDVNCGSYLDIVMEDHS